uniref:Uncharacterized protein n=1 Tax=Clandestinovirus TaxID=2831644 RepID=A0A8F8KL50_9VIRU|nr:hypothetical protein KOM_12_89 [Clandestinovirus]
MAEDFVTMMGSSTSKAFCTGALISRDMLVGVCLYGCVKYRKQKKSHRKAHKKLKALLKESDTKPKILGFFLVDGEFTSRMFVAYKTNRLKELQVIRSTDVDVQVDVVSDRKYIKVHSEITRFHKTIIYTTNNVVTL